MHPDDAAAPTMRRGEVFVPMHYPEGNRLTHPSFYRHSRPSNYKACAVAIIRKR
jgi:assimilatory nitrate reductase catalytic subunit